MGDGSVACDLHASDISLADFIEYAALTIGNDVFWSMERCDGEALPILQEIDKTASKLMELSYELREVEGRHVGRDGSA